MDPTWTALISAAIGGLVVSLPIVIKGRSDAAAQRDKASADADKRHADTLLAAKAAANQDRNDETESYQRAIKSLREQLESAEKRIKDGEERFLKHYKATEERFESVTKRTDECRTLLEAVQKENAGLVSALAKKDEEIKELRALIETLREKIEALLTERDGGAPKKEN